MKENSYDVIGLMSGTSLDGLDIAFCHFKKVGTRWTYKIIRAETVSYPPEIIGLLKDAFYKDEVFRRDADITYGHYLGMTTTVFCKKNGIHPDFIASHGHTVFHRPELGYTLQIGDGKTIAELTGIPVIYDFRSSDVEMGGQGAPLVPIGDRLLFEKYDYCLNIGGFCNISSSSENGTTEAFDIAPANMLLNMLAQRLGKPFDSNGSIAENGRVCLPMLQEINSLNYYSQTPPKSLGKEWFDANISPVINKYESRIEPCDMLRTSVEHIAEQISKVVAPAKKILISGGGAYNTFLVDRIKTLTECEIITPGKELIDYKEALIFALMGILRIRNEVNILASVTGAKCGHCSGKIAYPENKKAAD